MTWNGKTSSASATLPVSVALPGGYPAGSLADSDHIAGDRIFWRALGITTALKLVLAGLIPLTGDEAYFVLWGQHLDYGYYDHGAMTGWWLWVVLWFGKSEWLVRLPAVMTTVAVGVMLWRTLRPIDALKAGWVAALYLWSPHSVMNVFMTTDTPLLFFSAVAGVFAFRACRDDRAGDYLLAGVFLGLAFLSKYFAVLLGGAFAVLYLFCVGRPRILGLVLTFLGVLPSAAVNIAWNYNNGWTNIVFNLYTRQNNSTFSLLTVAAFIGTTLVLLGPLVWYLLRPRFPGRHSPSLAWQNWRQTGLVAFVVAFVVPQVVLFVVSFTNRIGVHWAMSFYPFLFAALPGMFDAGALRRMTHVMAVVGGSMAVVVMVAVLLPVEVARSHPSYASIVLSTNGPQVLSRLTEMNPQAVVATPSYSKSATLGYHHGSYVPVMGTGSYHARQDDLLMDLRELENRDILIITHKPSQAEECLPWFRRAQIREFEVRGARYYVVDGRGFRYSIYHRRVLRRVARNYYQVPSWLASWSPVSPFLLKHQLLPARDEGAGSNPS